MGIQSLLKRIVLQFALTLAIFAIPWYWVQSGKSFSATGLSILGCCACYALLPWDLIPDWIPIIGKLDDYLAILGIVAGGILAGIGNSVSV